MSRDIPDGPNPHLVVAGGVEGEVTEDLAGGGVADADVEVSDEHRHGGSGWLT
jgi:hypothetical protein